MDIASGRSRISTTRSWPERLTGLPIAGPQMTRARAQSAALDLIQAQIGPFRGAQVDRDGGKL
jgi:hypothetical protein